MRDVTFDEMNLISGGMATADGNPPRNLFSVDAINLIIQSVFWAAGALINSDTNKGKDGGQISDTPAA